VDVRLPQLTDIQEASILMLEARRAEKDFLIRLDEKYLHMVDNAVAGVIEHLHEAQPKEAGKIQTQLQQASLLVKTYHSNFKVVAQLIQQRGLNQDLGLRGQMRDAIHAMENRCFWWTCSCVVVTKKTTCFAAT
jgi:methyl-accepting chemotaxis protein